MDRDARHRETAKAGRETPIVRLRDVHKSFGPLPVLRGVSLDVRAGRTTVVLGPSGCGKSVMLKHVVGLLRPDAGEVHYEGTRLDGLSDVELRPIRREFGFLFQHGALFDSMSVRQNVEFPLVEHEHLAPRERRERALQVLDLVGLADSSDRMPAELSGGQRKRAALARAIVLRPRVILYDEPTTGLDPIRADVINELILELQRALLATSIVVTHDLDSAFKVADEMVMLHEGRVLLRDAPKAFRAAADPFVQRFLRGEADPRTLSHVHIEPQPEPRPAPRRAAVGGGG